VREQLREHGRDGRARRLVFVLATLALPLAPGCGKDSEDEPLDAHRLEPMRPPLQRPPRSRPQPAAAVETGGPLPSGEGELDSRPPADPEIERALNLVRDSELRFSVASEDPEARPTIYTAEQFASMLRSKWDWIGYDIVALDPWLDAIASKTFKDNRPYQVLYADGRSGDFRRWLDAALAGEPGPMLPTPGTPELPPPPTETAAGTEADTDADSDPSGAGAQP